MSTSRTTPSRSFLYAASAIAFVIGMCGAAYLFVTATPADENALVENYLHSKVYVHELKARGGSIAVIADELFRWFDGLWHGRSVSYIIAVVTAGTSAILFHLARMQK